MRFFPLASVALVASFTLFGAGCAASSDGESEDLDPTQAAAPQALSASHLSQDLVCAAVSAAENNAQGDGLKSIPQSKLKADSLHDFKAFQRNMLPDYPSEAFELPVKLGNKTYSFVMVIENNDGGGSMGIYRTDGSAVTTVGFSESEENPWSSPGDRCGSDE